MSAALAGHQSRPHKTPSGMKTKVVDTTHKNTVHFFPRQQRGESQNYSYSYSYKNSFSKDVASRRWCFLGLKCCQYFMDHDANSEDGLYRIIDTIY